MRVEQLDAEKAVARLRRVFITSKNPAYVMRDIAIVRAFRKGVELADDFFTEVDRLAKLYEELVSYNPAEPQGDSSKGIG